MKKTAIKPALSALAVLALVAACSSGGSPTWTFAPPTPSPSPGPATAEPSAGMSGMPGMPSGSPVATSPAETPAASEPAETPEASEPAETPEASSPAESPAASEPAESPEASDGTAPSGQVIELELTADLHIHQNGQPVDNLTVKNGETVRFRITNTAPFQHDFYIGPGDLLGQNLVAGLPGLASFDAGTQEFDYTVTADTANMQWGCSLPGHYPNMHGTFTVEP